MANHPQVADAVEAYITIPQVHQGETGTFKARIIDISERIPYDNCNGVGTRFAFLLRDETEAEIRGITFNSDIDLFIHKIIPGYTCSFSNHKIISAEYSKGPKEIVLDSSTEVQVLAHGRADRKAWTSISQLYSQKNGKFINTMGLIIDVEDIVEDVAESTGRDYKKRTITLWDPSGEIEVAIWGDDAIHFDADMGSVVILLNARVNDFNQVNVRLLNLSLGDGKCIVVDPEMPIVAWLRKVYENENGGLPAQEAL